MKKRAILLVAGLLAAALAASLVIQLNKKPGAYVVVRIDGREAARYSLTQSQTVSLNGGTNILQIEDGKAWLTEASCPDHICVKMGVIDEVGEVITCLPNRLTVTVYGAESGVDLVS